MNPYAAFGIKAVGAGGAAALLSLGAAGVLAASPTPHPTPNAAASSPDRHADRKLVRQAALEAEADVLGIPEGTLVADLKKGQKVSDLANERHMTKEQFAGRLVIALKPRLEQLVDHKQITQARAGRILDRISKGDIPFWNGAHRR